MTYRDLILLLGVFGCVAAFLAVVLLAGAKFRAAGRRAAPEPAPGEAPRASLSLLAGLSFFAGLGSLLLVTVSGILAMSLSMSGVINTPASMQPDLELAARILLYVGLLPAAGAVALALGARGAISESREKHRGRPLYRTGVLLAVLTGVIVLDSKIVNPSTWAAAGENLLGVVSGGAPVDRAYFGATHQASSDSKGNLVIQVEAGSPAEKAGLRAGDRILGANGMLLGNKELLAERFATFEPGSRVTLEVLRGEESLSLVAELGSSLAQFAPLLSLLEDQSLDDERLAVLKAAGYDRGYTADELSRICRTFDFDDSRLKVIERALPHLRDRQNAYLLLATLDFSDAKSRVSRWIEETKPK
jgi:hypothetical protein